MNNELKVYTPMRVNRLGSLSELTLGSGGSSLDGTGLYNQLGDGNDGGKGKSGK